MRTISRGRNRFALAIGGLLLLIAGAWIATASTSLNETWPQGEQFLPDGHQTFSEFAAMNQPWILPVAFAVSVFCLVFGVVVLWGQIPKSPATSNIQITDDQDQLLASIEPKVFERALQEIVDNYPGVLDSSVYFGGSARAPWLQAEITVAEDSQVDWVVRHTRAGLANAIQASLGVLPQRLDLQVKLGSGSGSTSKRLKVGSQVAARSEPR
ncbi:hypothetical protein [Corynebacterium freiburgense]|uniref:hypothetical protein n=1 Tax=Corynebacterium freiburgense TaxID=556548 RepID=UPI00040BE4DC|nr:hypothetical protein [Corynebacterium freiburgense]WJZ01974.1 hypothetical protein CFREI_03355 [Corynebacterium freiburgense]